MKKILVIEDNTEVRENIAELLELSGYQVYTAENGKIGVEIAMNGSPDLILCDVMMPEMDGFGVLRILGANPVTADLPFIFLTAKAEKTDFRKGMGLGADDYITKPFDDVELLDAIEMRLQKSERIKKLFDSTQNGLQTFFDEARAMRELTKLSEDREIRRFKKKDIIFEEGQYPTWIYFVAEGKVKTYKTNEFGKDLILDIINGGEFFGYLPVIRESKYEESAAALEDCSLCLIPKEDFFLLINNNKDFSAQFIKMLANNVTEIEEQLLNLAYNSVRKRVANSLCTLHEKFSASGQDRFSILRDDLASLAGTAKETVIRTLSDFKEEKLIDIQGNEIVILDAQRLADMPN